MPHWRKMYDSRFIGSWDLEEAGPVVATIKDVTMEEVQDNTGHKETKPAVWFTKGKKALLLNKTNAKAIAKLYGTHTEKWGGKQIELFPTECDAFGDKVECVRVRKPSKKKAAPPLEDDGDLIAGLDGADGE